MSMLAAQGMSFSLYNSKSLCDIFIKGKLAGLGIYEITTGMRQTIITRDLERTLCDVIRSRNKLDPQIVIGTFKKFDARRYKDLNRLYENSTKKWPKINE